MPHDETPHDKLPAEVPAELPLREHVERAITDYLTHLDGHHSAPLHDLVLREIEEPLCRVVLQHTGGNQTRAASILGLNRATLRRKLRELGLARD